MITVSEQNGITSRNEAILLQETDVPAKNEALFEKV